MATFILKLRLLFSLFFFTLKFISVYFYHLRATGVSFALLVSMVSLILLTFFRMQHQISQEQIRQITFSTTLPHSEVILNRTTLNQRLLHLEKLQKLQPNHRDILFNISLLKRATYDQTEAFLYWDNARKLDPNNPLFKQE